MTMNAIIKITRPGVGQGAGGRAIWRRTHLFGVGMLTALMAAIYSEYALVLNYTFHTSSYDLVIFDQAVRSYASFQPGISIMKGVHNGFGPHFSVLGDHWSPIIASLAPLYRIHNSPETLLVAQAVLFALAIPSLWIFTRRAFGGGRKATWSAYFVSVAYALSWPIVMAARAGFHEVAFAPLLTAVALERLQAGRLRSALVALAALLLVKEDMGFFVAGIGVFLAVSQPRMVRKQGLIAVVLIIGGIADTFLATYVLIPAFGGRSDYYWAYTALGSNLPQAVEHLVTHPVGALKLLITPRVKLDTMLWLFGAFCFLPLLSPISLATIPLLLERMLGSKFPNWWVIHFQYNAFLVIVLACAAVDGAARLDRWTVPLRQQAGRTEPAHASGAPPVTEAEAARQSGLAGEAQADAGGALSLAGRASTQTGVRVPGPRLSGTVALVCAAAMCGLAVVLVPRFPLGAALYPAFYHRNGHDRAAAAAAAAVPSGVTVEAVNEIGPHLSARDTVLLWDEEGPRWAPWVVARVSRKDFTFRSSRQQRQRVALLERSGYTVVFHRAGYVVLHRDSTQASADTAKSRQG